MSFVALFLAIFPAGAGHGWGAPLFVSIALPFIYPTVMLRARESNPEGWLLDLAMVALAVGIDIYLGLDLAHYSKEWLSKPRDILPGVDRSVFPIFLLWLLLWLHWQFVALRTLLRNARVKTQG